MCRWYFPLLSSPHRRNADNICVVEDGRVVETGNHDELIRAEGGKYLQLVKLQLGGAINPDGCVLNKLCFEQPVAR